MAKYYLTLNTTQKIMNDVIWTYGTYEHCKPNDLESIDNFCMDFDSARELKGYLSAVAIRRYQEGIITEFQNFNNELKIRYRYNKEIKSLSYGIPYTKDRKYFDYEYLRETIQSLKNDSDFLLGLFNHFGGSSNQSFNPKKASLDKFFYNSLSLKNRGEYDKSELFFAIDDFIRVQIFEYEKGQGYKVDKEGRLIYKWRQLHDLAMYVRHYQENKDKAKEEITDLEEIKLILRGKIPGQLDLFDK